MRLILAVCAGALAVGCTPGAAPGVSETHLATARAVGEAVDCVETNQIFHAQVRSPRVIDFRLRDGRVYRNALPNSCPGLNYQSFSYEPTLSRLCSIDVITVRASSGMPGPACGLGSFQEIEGGGA